MFPQHLLPVPSIQPTRRSILLLLLLINTMLFGQNRLEDAVSSIKELPLNEQRDRFLEAAESTAATPLESARYYHELGVVHYRMGNMLQAIQRTEQALNLRLEHEASAGEEVINSAYNLGSMYANIEHFDEAFAHFQLIVDRSPNGRLGESFFRLGNLYRDIGEFELGEQAFREAGKLPPFSEEPTLRATLLAEWGDLYLKQEEPTAARAAIPHLEEAFATYEELAGSDDYYNGPATLALNRLGLAYNYDSRFRKAIKYFEKALAYNDRCCDDAELEAVIRSNMGITYRRMGQLEKAEQLQREALEIRLRTAQEGQVQMGIARSYDNLATTLLDLDRPRDGLESIQKGLAWALPAFTAAGIEEMPALALLEQSPHKNSLLTYLQDKGDLWYALSVTTGDKKLLDQSLTTYKRCDQLIDLIRKDHLEKNTKLYWRDQARSMYQSAVKAAWTADRREEAFYFSEKSRAVLLLDGLQELNANSRLPQAMQQQLSRLAAQIQYLQKTAYEETSAESNPPTDGELTVLQEQYRHLLDSIETAYPDYYQQKYNFKPLDLQDLQSRLNPDEVWVEYFLSSDFSLALIIRPEQISMVEVAAPDILAPQIERLVNGLQRYDTEFDPEPALALHRFLIEPLDLDPNLKMTIVPDAQLSLIPFEVLLGTAPDAADYRNWDFLINRYQISYAFSANSHFLTTKTNARGNGKVLAFAPMAVAAPEYGIDTELELPQTRFTVDYIAGLLPTDVYIGADARRTLIGTVAPQASVLHLATHAYLNHERPEFSYFLVADADPAQRRFYVHELYQHQFQADLAVLSACETGGGKLFRGEGIASIGRAFAQNGCPNLTMSLWPVDEGATGRLLERYYQAMEAGTPKAEALHRAKRDYLTEAATPALAHPFRWAGFVYYGQNTPLVLGEKSIFNRPSWLLLGLGLVAMIILITRRKRN